MLLTCISDTHGQHRQLAMSKYPADTLVFAGDWTRGKDLGLSETADFLQWFSEQPYKHLVCIAGNHEIQVEANTESLSELLLMYPNITYLNNSEVTLDGIKFWGSPYSNEFCNWAFMDNDLALAKIWNEIPDDTDVLITHGPAYGSGDLVKRAYGRDPHVGSKSLTKRKQELAGTLKAHISGHIHEGYSINGANPINVCASILDERYQLVNKPITITI